MLAVIVPAYNEAQNIQAAAREICGTLTGAGISHTLIFVDDGSEDESFLLVEGLKKELPQVEGLRFSRNFGKEAAIMAGLAQGELLGAACSVVMDGDLQHPPSCLPRMYALWQEGYPLVEGVKSNRGQEGAVYGFLAKAFYGLVERFTRIDLSRASDYKLMDQSVVRLLLQLPEKDPFFRGLSAYFGFKAAQVPFEVAPRRQGTTKWSSFGLLRYAMNNLTSFSVFPLHAVTLVGCVLMGVFVLLGLQTLYNYFSGHAIEGFTTVILLLLLIGSALLISLGIIGHYIARIYIEVKGRPRYVIEETTAGLKGEQDRD